jgi:hypothetical protein
VGLPLRAIGLANGHRGSNSQRRCKQWKPQHYPIQVLHCSSFKKHKIVAKSVEVFRQQKQAQKCQKRAVLLNGCSMLYKSSLLGLLLQRVTKQSEVCHWIVSANGGRSSGQNL